MSVTQEEIAREKDRLPRGWGRFGKSIDEIAELSGPDESLLSTCVAINPDFQHRTITLAGGLLEMTKSTNVVLALTNKRLVLIGTGMGGAPRTHYDAPFADLGIVDRQKKEFTLRLGEAQVRFKGAAKQMTPEFLDALDAQTGR